MTVDSSAGVFTAPLVPSAPPWPVASQLGRAARVFLTRGQWTQALRVASGLKHWRAHVRPSGGLFLSHGRRTWMPCVEMLAPRGGAPCWPTADFTRSEIWGLFTTAVLTSLTGQVLTGFFLFWFGFFFHLWQMDGFSFDRKYILVINDATAFFQSFVFSLDDEATALWFLAFFSRLRWTFLFCDKELEMKR